MQFVELVFGDQKEQTFLAGSVPNDKAIRVVGYYSDERMRAMPDNERHHVSAGIYPPGMGGRLDKHLIAAPCIVFDDVGQMPPQGTIPIHGGIEVDELVFAFLPPPSWIMETSKGRYQYGYMFEPMLDQITAVSFNKQLKRNADLGAGVHSVGQYFRTPSGTNTKPGRGDFRTRLVSFDGRTYTADEFAKAFGLQMPNVAAPPPKVSVSGGEQVSLETLRAILADLPNDQSFDSRDDWVKVIHAIYGASDGSDEGKALAIEWSEQHPSFDLGETTRVWDTIQPSEVKASATTLRRILEERHGRDSDTYRKHAARIAFDEENGALPLDDASAQPTTAAAPPPGDIVTAWVRRGAKNIPPRDWLYGTAYIRRFVTGLVAPGGTGKTSLSFVEALSMVTGKPLLGVTPRLPLRVGIWNGEDPRDELDRRLEAIMLHYNLTDADIGDRLYVGSSRDVREKDRLITAKMVEGAVHVQRPVIDRVSALIKRERLDVLTIDPFISSHRVPENSNDAIEAVVKEWAGVSEACNCCILLVHHLRKMDLASSEVTADDARGASSYRDALRVLRLVATMDKNTAGKQGIKNPRAYFRVVDGKASMSPAMAGDEWYRFVSVSLQNGRPFDTPPMPDDSVGVVTRWSVPVPTEGKQDGDIGRVQAAVSTGGPWRQSPQSDEWVGVAVAGALGLDIGVGLERNELNASQAGMRKHVGSLVAGWLRDGWLKIEQVRDGNRNKRPGISVGKVWSAENEQAKTAFEGPSASPE